MPLAASLLLLAWFAVAPGWLLLSSLQSLNEGLRLRERLAAAVGLSAVATVASGIVLARLELFRLEYVLASHVAILVVGAVLGRKALAEDARALTGWLRRKPAYPSLAGVAAALAIGIVAALYGANAFGGVPSNGSPFLYVADASALIEDGGIPDTTVQWGVERPFALSKFGASTWLASLTLLTGLEELELLQYGLLVVIGVALVGAWAFLRLLFSPFGASAGVVLLFANYPMLPLTLRKLTKLSVEGIAIAFGFLALWAVIRADREQRLSLQLLAAGLVLMIGLMHGVVFLVVLMAIGAYYLPRMLARATGLRWATESALLLLVAPVVLVASGLLLGSEPEVLAGGRETSSYVYVEGIRDPTAALAIALHGGSIFSAPPPDASFAPAAADYFDAMFGRTLRADTFVGELLFDLRVVLAIAAALVVLGGMIAWPSLRGPLATLGLFSAALYAFALLFAYRYDLWIFTQHPIRRELPYFGIALALLVVLLLDRRRPGTLKRDPGTLIRSTLLVVLPVVALASTLAAERSWHRTEFTSEEEQVLAAVEEFVPPHATILTNTRTVALFRLSTDRVSLTEGGVPYVFPDLLTHSLEVLDGAQQWFASPTTQFLYERGVDYVLAVRPTPGEREPRLGGNLYAVAPGTNELAALDFLDEVRGFEHFTLYRVDLGSGSAAAISAPPARSNASLLIDDAEARDILRFVERACEDARC